MRSVFSGVIDPNPKLSCEHESFLEKNLIFMVLLTIPIGLLRIALTHDNALIFLNTFCYF